MSNSPIFTSTSNAILQNRLTRLQSTLRALSYSTRQDYAAAVYSALNQVLLLGYNMVPLNKIQGGQPAIVGDFQNNLTILNNNAQDVVAEVEALEDQTSELYNLVALTQNSVRQQIREVLYAPTPGNYLEPFINNLNLDPTNTTATLDYSVGLATLPLLSDTEITPASIIVGTASTGSVVSGQGVDQLNGPVGNFMAWNGSTLELSIAFSVATTINRITIVQDNYQGLLITGLTGSADGVVYNDLTKDLNISQLSLDGTSGKFSGEVVIDFQPRSLLQVNLTLEDATGQDYIALRGLTFDQRQYSSTGQIQSNKISSPTGNVLFSTIQNPANSLVTLTHMISYDGVNFQAIQPEAQIALAGSPFWYRGVFAQNSSDITTLSGPLAVAQDPQVNSNYTVTQTSTINLGNNIMQRTIAFGSVSGPVTFQDMPLPGTFSVWQGSIELASTAYAFYNNVLTFPSSVVNVTVVYQASSSGNAGLQALLNYYSPYLYQFQFEAV